MLLQKNKLLNIVTVLALLLFAAFFACEYALGTLQYYWPDTVIFAGIMLFFYFTYNKWRLNVPLFTLLVLGMASHLTGCFGWYANSPIFLQWDHVTHFLGIMPFAMIFFNLVSKWFSKEHKTRTVFLIVICLFAAMGIGCVIEMTEFIGFLSLGFGEGFFYFGAGDALPGQQMVDSTTILDQISVVGGGWFNTCWDLIWNAIGAGTGIIIMILARLLFPRKKNLFDKYVPYYYFL